MPSYCYILFSPTLNKYYVGSTPDIDRRITDHNRGKEKFTRAGIPWNLVYQEYFENLPDVRRRESFIKKMKSRKFIKSLITNYNSSAG